MIRGQHKSNDSRDCHIKTYLDIYDNNNNNLIQLIMKLIIIQITNPKVWITWVNKMTLNYFCLSSFRNFLLLENKSSNNPIILSCFWISDEQISLQHILFLTRIFVPFNSVLHSSKCNCVSSYFESTQTGQVRSSYQFRKLHLTTAMRARNANSKLH